MNKTLIGKVEKVREHFGEGKVKWLVEELGLNEGGDKMKKFVETLEGVRSKKVGGRDLQELGRLVRVLPEIEEILRYIGEEELAVIKAKGFLDGLEEEYRLEKTGCSNVGDKKLRELDKVSGGKIGKVELFGWRIVE